MTEYIAIPALENDEEEFYRGIIGYNLEKGMIPVFFYSDLQRCWVRYL